MGDVKKETDEQQRAELHRQATSLVSMLVEWFDVKPSQTALEGAADVTFTRLAHLPALRQPDARMEGGGLGIHNGKVVDALGSPVAAPSPPTVGELEVVVWDRLRELIGEYFDLGYAEGVAQRDADTMAGDAQRTLSEIEGIISAAQSNKHGLEQLLEEKRAAINSLRPLFHSTKAQLAEARKVLERISSPTQTEGILWWQIEARAFLASLGEKQDAE